MSNVAGFECVECGRRHSIGEAEYICVSCGGNLDVLYDYDGVRAQIIFNRFDQVDARRSFA